MSLVRFDDVGSVGVIKDLPSHDLPQQAWSDAQNVRFHDGKVEKMTGHTNVFNMSASLTQAIAINPWWVLPVQTGANYYWLYAGKNKVYAAAPNNNSNNITRYSTATASDINYSSTPSIRWNGGMLGGIAIVNNGIDEPQMWNQVGLTTRLRGLSYNTSAGTTWANANLTAKVVRPFQNFLVALDVTKAGTRFPYMVKWSHPADPGAIPETWDETDPTKDAGETDLADTVGYVIDCLPLRNINIIYKEDATWGMQYIGGSFVFRFYQIFKSFGAISRDCAVNFYQNQIVLSNSDVVIHDGQSAKSLVDKKWRKWLFNNIDSDYFENCYLVRNFIKNEVWICFPTTGVSPAYFPNMALVWNYKENTFTVRELPGIPHIQEGIVQPETTNIIWTSVLGTWGAYIGSWGQRSYTPTSNKLLMASSDSASALSVPKLLLADDSEQFDGVNFKAYVERYNIPLGRADRNGQRKIDHENIKQVTSLYPRIEAIDGTKVVFYIGTHAHTGDHTLWGSAMTFTVGESLKLDMRHTGRHISIRAEASANATWKFTGYDLEVDKVGKF